MWVPADYEYHGTESLLDEIFDHHGKGVEEEYNHDTLTATIAFLGREIKPKEPFIKKIKIGYFEFELTTIVNETTVTIETRRDEWNSFVVIDVDWKCAFQFDVLCDRITMRKGERFVCVEVYHEKEWLAFCPSLLVVSVRDYCRIEENPLNIPDATLICEGQEFVVCKAIVGQWSTVLHEIFQRHKNCSDENTSMYEVTNCTADELRTFLVYIEYKYSDFGWGDLSMRMKALNALGCQTAKSYLEEFIIDDPRCGLKGYGMIRAKEHNSVIILYSQIIGLRGMKCYERIFMDLLKPKEEEYARRVYSKMDDEMKKKFMERNALLVMKKNERERERFEQKKYEKKNEDEKNG